MSFFCIHIYTHTHTPLFQALGFRVSGAGLRKHASKGDSSGNFLAYRGENYTFNLLPSLSWIPLLTYYFPRYNLSEK